jgi:phosphopantothenoylcysteine decarboxylase/phosphopantothenate--cysteine ligase
MILIGVCGGIAAYKSCELVRTLVRAGHDVQVVLTPAAERFVGPTTFAALSRRPVLTEEALDVFPHLAASGDAELMCIAPLTATTLARLAQGEASTVLTASALALRGPLLAAPAMNPRMWDAAATRHNIAVLQERGVELIGPEAGDTAEGEQGIGRMAEPDVIADHIVARLEAGRRLAGRSVLVTAGGTREPLDAVRYVGNRSSGKMGVAVADEAARRGAEVTLVLAAATARPSAPMHTVRVSSAAEMGTATLAAADAADVVVMSAAVSDYSPAEPDAGKRTKDGKPWIVTMQPTPDILQELGRRRRPGQVLVGFAAEHGDGAVDRARSKLERKGVDMIVMNDISRRDIGFEADSNEIVIVTSHEETGVSRRSKQRVAAAIWDAIDAVASSQPA